MITGMTPELLLSDLDMSRHSLWTRQPILACVRSLCDSYFTLLAPRSTHEFVKNSGGHFHKIVFEIQPENLASRKKLTSELVAEVSYYHLRITIESRGEIQPKNADIIQLKIQKEWRRGYKNRPKWRKFGRYANLSLKQHYALNDAEYIMES